MKTFHFFTFFTYSHFHKLFSLGCVLKTFTKCDPIFKIINIFYTLFQSSQNEILKIKSMTNKKQITKYKQNHQQQQQQQQQQQNKNLQWIYTLQKT